MEHIKSRTQSYVIKIWIEGASQKRINWTLSGRITSVPDGDEAYFLNLYEIPQIILSNLLFKGVKLPWRYRLKLWLQHKGPSRR
jgi:P pilus assembly chaperone PapD